MGEGEVRDRSREAFQRLAAAELPALYSLARRLVRDGAEDMVQETFLAALRGSNKFAGRSPARSWLVGILKHKILDHYRKSSRETSFTDLEFLQDECAEKFVPEGYWVHMNGPKEWKPEADEVARAAGPELVLVLAPHLPVGSDEQVADGEFELHLLSAILARAMQHAIECLA